MRLISTVTILFLAACSGSGRPAGTPGPSRAAEPPPTTEYFTQRCVAYGYEPGTGEMAECLQREELDYRLRPRAAP